MAEGIFRWVQGDAGDGSDEDILEDYVLSDEEDGAAAAAAEAEEKQPRHRQSGRKAPVGKVSKGHKAAASKGHNTGPSKGSHKSKATKSKHRQR